MAGGTLVLIAYPPFLSDVSLLSLSASLVMSLYRHWFIQGILRGKYHCTIDLLFDRFGLVRFANKTKIVSCHTADSKTSQTGGQWYSDTSPFSIPWFIPVIGPNIGKEMLPANSQI
jgi:hypothetical protein